MKLRCHLPAGVCRSSAHVPPLPPSLCNVIEGSDETCETKKEINKYTIPSCSSLTAS